MKTPVCPECDYQPNVDKEYWPLLLIQHITSTHNWLLADAEDYVEVRPLNKERRTCHIDGYPLQEISDNEAMKILNMSKEEFTGFFGETGDNLLACNNGHIKTSDGTCFNCDECANRLSGSFFGVNKN